MGFVFFDSGFLKEGCELINEALNLFNNVYGAMHVELCACLRLLARLNYIMGDYSEVRPPPPHRPLLDVSRAICSVYRNIIMIGLVLRNGCLGL